MKLYTGIALLFLATSGSVVDAQEKINYWPLEIGNQWIFAHIVINFSRGEVTSRDTTDFVHWEIVKSTVKSGKQYFVFNNGQMIREESGSYYLLHQEKGLTKEVLIFNFSNGPQSSSFPPPPFNPLPHIIPPYIPHRYVYGTPSNEGKIYSISLSRVDLHENCSVFFLADFGILLTQYNNAHQTIKYELIRANIADKAYDFSSRVPTGVTEKSWGMLKSPRPLR